MKRNQIKELSTKTVKELSEMMKSLKSDVLDVRMELSQNKVKKVTQIRRKKDDIARIKTILRMRELAG